MSDFAATQTTWLSPQGGAAPLLQAHPKHVIYKGFARWLAEVDNLARYEIPNGTAKGENKVPVPQPNGNNQEIKNSVELA